ncbi:MAG TPA: CDP-alcohol phosphatidyltransferase family protein [Candidatus Dormibacteraeota bacterium]
MFTSQFQEWIRATARRLVCAIGLDRVSPNTLTVLGLLVNLTSAILVGAGLLFAGGLVLLLASVFDILDGAVARVTGKVYRYGAFLDSASDRYAEVFTGLGLIVYYQLLPGKHTVEPILIIAALAGSLMVSYVRARAQSLGFVCDGGLLARPERVVLTAIGLLVNPLLLPVLWVLAVFTNVTALQRIWFVYGQSRATAAAD